MEAASNSGGDIRVDEADKDVIASTSSGSITIKKVNGGVEAKNSGGDITIAWRFRAATSR